MNKELIKFFNVALVDNSNVVDFTVLNKYAMERGYLVHPSICNESVYGFLKDETINCNATFYKTWEDIESRSRLGIFIDQIFHYITLGEYVPNENGGENIPYNTFKVIMPITEEELYNKCYDVLTSGIALKHDTMSVISDYVCCYSSSNKDVAFCVDDIKNREAQTYICDKLNITPNDKFSLFRYIIYKTTQKTLVIKNKELINSIKNSECQFDFSQLSENQLIELSSIFFRFKPLFLAFKKSIYTKDCGYRFTQSFVSHNSKYINKLRKLAIKHHKPMKVNILNDIYNDKNNLEEVKKHLNEVTLFKIVSLMQGCNARMQEYDNSTVDRLYVIRNQKTYMKNVDVVKDNKKFQYYNNLYFTLHSYLVEKLSEKKCIVKYPDNYVLTAPSSEKNFIGNYPFGTYFDMTDKNNFLGIYWREGCGTRDFDLSYQDMNGRRIGWNSEWCNNEVLFSGDMVRPLPDATEVLYFKNKVTDGLIYVNRYDGEPYSKYKIFFGQEEIEANNFKRGYMVDPNNVKVMFDMESPQNMQQSVGCIFNNRVYLMELTNANIRVADSNTRYEKCLRDKLNTFIDLKTLLEEAGFTESKEVYNESGELVEEKVDIDLTNLDKSTLINLFK